MEEFRTRVPGVTIRPARADEAPLVLKFIIELADYEGLAHEVEATEKLIREHLFGRESPSQSSLRLLRRRTGGIRPLL